MRLESILIEASIEVSYGDALKALRALRALRTYLEVMIDIRLKACGKFMGTVFRYEVSMFVMSCGDPQNAQNAQKTLRALRAQ